ALDDARREDDAVHEAVGLEWLGRVVFHAGAEAGMHLRGAGLPDQLSYRLGQAVDLVGVRGSGLVQARKQLFFRATSEPGYWDRKRAVVWVFSEREWTQLSDRLVSIPLDR
ncbi:MAG: hypothetical protein AAF491_00765, partial [Verrucomicrobiota bacterium]